jgi:hypothetical protein
MLRVHYAAQLEADGKIPAQWVVGLTAGFRVCLQGSGGAVTCMVVATAPIAL